MPVRTTNYKKKKKKKLSSIYLENVANSSWPEKNPDMFRLHRTDCRGKADNIIHFIINKCNTHLINCPTYMLAVFECHLVRYRWKETLFVMDFPLILARANEKVSQFHREELASNCCSTEVLCK